MRRKACYEGYTSKYYTVRPLGLVAYEMGVPVNELKDIMQRDRVRAFKEDGGPMVLADKMRKAVIKRGRMS